MAICSYRLISHLNVFHMHICHVGIYIHGIVFYLQFKYNRYLFNCYFGFFGLKCVKNFDLVSLLIEDNTNAMSLYLLSDELLLVRFWFEIIKECLALDNAFHDKHTEFTWEWHLPRSCRSPLQQDTITRCKHFSSMTWKCKVFISFLVTHYLFVVYLLIFHWLISCIFYFFFDLYQAFC